MVVMEGVPRQFSSPQEEIEYLRNQIAERERALLDRTPEIDQTDIETVGKQEVEQYGSFTPKMVLDPSYELTPEQLSESVEGVAVAHNKVEEILGIAFDKGIKNALTVLEKTGDAYTYDEVHRRLIEHIRSGADVADLKEGVPPWHVLHMSLFEISLPAQTQKNEPAEQLAKLVGLMQQLLYGMRAAASEKEGKHFVIEVAVDNATHDIIYYVAVPNEYVTLFEKQALSIFPHAVLTLQPHDYNIFADGGHTVGSEAALEKHPIYPLQKHDVFVSDPFYVILNAFSKLEQAGEGAALQFVIRYPRVNRRKNYESIIRDVEKGVRPQEAIRRSSFVGGVAHALVDVFKTTEKKDQDRKEYENPVDNKAIEQFRKKIESDIVDVNIRLLVSAQTSSRSNQVLREVESAFHQFANVEGNQFAFSHKIGGGLKRLEKAFSFREFTANNALSLSIDELSTIVHFPDGGGTAAPQFKESYAQTAAAPTNMPNEGTLLGINKHRGTEKEIYVTEKDRMRHFYVIGQTGTGKSVFLQNLIVQDIKAGAGVCMIDPHGSDIQDVMGAIPPERYEDVIYFDPSNLDRSIGLNMLEYDPQKPEQKTFVVNELLSIFQKLYGANPESMGPMFEQYFRNATMLVMEDPASGNTLMDIGRVMADARFRREKLAKATNPTVVSFWKEIATKAGGESSLENIVPYIVSKIDPLTANDYIRPIIGQQTSAFNFRQIMDQRKILLVNLSKGRLGEINANLIGMIIVGKILMAALSRVDDPTKSFPPFYLHIDEFQNVSTDSISAILSEARKYKLGLTVAHQFIAQLDPVIRDAVFGNVGSMAAFRVGNDDANALEPQFAPVFSASDIMNTPNYNAVMRVLADGTPTRAFSVATMPPPESDPNIAEQLIAWSSARYGRPRAEVEAEIQERYRKPTPPPPPPMPPMP
jgi:hypothetical protein